MHLRQVLDNTALDAIQQQLGIEQPSVEQGNSLVSTVMAAATAPVRFPGAPLLLSSCGASPQLLAAHVVQTAHVTRRHDDRQDDNDGSARCASWP